MNNINIYSQFQDLYKENQLVDNKNLFIKDGIINPSKFYRQKIKILFIAKEHNYIGNYKDNDYKADYRDWWNYHVKFQFSHRICEWSYGILNNFDSNYNQLSKKEKLDYLQSIAFINVKKTSGSSSSNPKVICEYINHSRDLLYQQIREIAPTLIVCCFRYDFYLEQLFGTNQGWITSNNFSYGKWHGINVINFYHPSSRKNKQLLYALMKEAVEQLHIL